MRNFTECVLLSGAAIAALTTAGDALAQDAIDEIVVTARRVEENVQSTPVAVTALTDEQMDVQQIETISDLAATVPNLSATGGPQGATDANFFIRGVGQFDFIVTNDPGVGVYVDGVYLGRTVGALVDTGAVQRIEVLKGPQGTLFGRNTIGGAINVTTKAPEIGAFSGEAELTVGSRDRVDFEAGVNLPLGEKAALLVYGQARAQDGWRERVDAFGVPGDGATFGDIERESLNGSLLFEPTDTLSVTLRADWTEDSGSPRPVLLAGAVEGFGAGPMTPPTVPPGINAPFGELDDDETIQGGPAVSEAEVWGTSGTVEADLGAVTLRSITAYRELNAFSNQDNDASPFNIYDSLSDAEQSQFSQELQLFGGFMDDRMGYLLGAYYFEEEARQVQRLCLFSLGIPGDPRCGFSFQDNDQDVESWAVFGEVDFALTDDLALVLGGRYTEETKDILANQRLDFSVLQTVGAPAPFAPPGGMGPSFDPRFYVLPTLDGVEQSISFEQFTPRIGLNWQASDDLFVFANYSEGYRSGGFNGRIFVPSQEIPTFEPDTNTSYEIGFKSDWLERRLRVNGTAFYTKYEDIQQTVTDPVLQFFVANAAEAELKGFELEVTAVPIDNALINVAIGVTQSEFTETDDSTIPARVVAGNELAFTPDFSSAIGASYDFDLGQAGSLLTRVDYNYMGDHFFSPANQPLEFQEGYGLLNLTLVYSPVGEAYEFSVFGTNVLDEEYNTFGQDARFNQGVAFVFPARPAEWGASLSVDF